MRNKELDNATGAHFNLPGHIMVDMKVTIVEKVSTDDPPDEIIKRKLQKYGTHWKGINRKT